MSDTSASPPLTELRDELIRLGPWHLDVEITPELSTRAFLEAPAGTYADSLGKVGFRSPREGFIERMLRIYPNGLEGRSVMDCACNCGGYLFWAKEIGAGDCFGFDVRRHWIDQAKFLAEHRAGPTDGMRFEVCDLYDLPTLGLDHFDVTLFNDILYHLPDPVSGLKLAADLTDEMLLVNTAARTDLPDGALAISEEGRSQVMSGVYGLNWFPTGPEVVADMLRWLGFPETRCSRWRRSAPEQPDALGRIEVLGSRNPRLFDRFDVPMTGARLRSATRLILANMLPPGTRVVVLGDDDGETLAIDGLETEHLPLSQAEGEELVSRLETLAASGSEYVVVPASVRADLAKRETPSDPIEDRYPLEFSEHRAFELFSLREH